MAPGPRVPVPLGLRAKDCSSDARDADLSPPAPVASVPTTSAQAKALELSMTPRLSLTAGARKSQCLDFQHLCRIQRHLTCSHPAPAAATLLVLQEEPLPGPPLPWPLTWCTQGQGGSLPECGEAWGSAQPPTSLFLPLEVPLGSPCCPLRTLLPWCPLICCPCLETLPPDPMWLGLSLLCSRRGHPAQMASSSSLPPWVHPALNPSLPHVLSGSPAGMPTP